MKRILFALSLFLVLCISTNAFSEDPPKTFNNMAEVELMIEKKAAEVTDKTRAEIEKSEDRLWEKAGIELDQSREALEDARAMVSRELGHAKAQLEDSRATFNLWLIILSIVVALVGIAFPIFFSRKVRKAEKYVGNIKKETEKAKVEAESARDDARKAKDETEITKKEIEKAMHEVEYAKKNIEKVKDEAEDNLRKIEGLHIEARKKVEDISTITASISGGNKEEEFLTGDERRAVDEVATDEDAPAEVRLLAQALKAQDEDRWDDALKLWRALDILEPEDDQTLFGIGYSLQEMGLHSEAIEKYEELSRMDIGENKSLILNNLGNALSDQAKDSDDVKEAGRLYKEAYEKYKEVIEINPDYYRAFDNWAYTLSQQARTNDGKEADKLFEKAKEKSLKAEAIKVGSGSYNLACIVALQGRGGDCRSWLEKTRKYKELPSYNYIKEDKDFDNVRNEPWFKEFLEKVRKEEEAKKS